MTLFRSSLCVCAGVVPWGLALRYFFQASAPCTCLCITAAGITANLACHSWSLQSHLASSSHSHLRRLGSRFSGMHKADSWENISGSTARLPLPPPPPSPTKRHHHHPARDVGHLPHLSLLTCAALPQVGGDSAERSGTTRRHEFAVETGPGPSLFHRTKVGACWVGEQTCRGWNQIQVCGIQTTVGALLAAGCCTDTGMLCPVAALLKHGNNITCGRSGSFMDRPEIWVVNFN